MTALVDVVIEDERWQRLDLEGIAAKAAVAALEISHTPQQGYEICIMGCSDTQIAELNAEFREKPTATNVLSWPAFTLAPAQAGGQPTPPPSPSTPEESLGDIAIAYDTCVREAAEKSIPIADHVTHLVLHGCLHLLGYDHETDADAEIMEGLEIKALAKMGLNNPY